MHKRICDKVSRFSLLLLVLAGFSTLVIQPELVLADRRSKTGTAKTLKPPASADADAKTSPNLADFDAYVQRSMQDWTVPGAAIVIIKEGKVVLSKGYGFRDLKSKLPVTEHTLFPIASITKSFTVATLATLASEGKLDWDKPVREYMPDFRLSDDVLTARVTPRDLVTHRTGLPRHDGTWYRSGLTREDMYARLRYLEPNRDLRREFQYNNLMFMTAGYMAGKLSGSSWEDAVRTRIFAPLGMKSSNFNFGESFSSASDVAHPYRKDDKEVAHEAPIYPGDRALGPAGSIVSNLEDMTQYLMMYMNQGKHGNQQVISVSDIRQMISPQMVIHGSDLDPEIGYNHYGMGLFVTTYRGHKFVEHGGNLDGFSLLISFLPEENIGSIVLLNMEASSLREVLAYNINDRMLGLPPVDWNRRELDRYFAFKKADDDARNKNYVPRREHTAFAHPLDEYLGEYSNPAYGTVIIERSSNGQDLKISYHGMQSTAQHWHYDVWRVPHDPLDLLEETEIMFHTNWEGYIDSLSSSMEPQVKDIEFTRMPDRRMRDKSFLEPLAGVYQIADFKMLIVLRSDGVLTLATPNQKVYELEPVRGYTFAVKGENGQTIDFKRDESGRVTEFALSQAGSSEVYNKTQ